MRKVLLYLLTVVFLCRVQSVSAQNYCGTKVDFNASQEVFSRTISTADCYIVRVFIHLVHNSDGTGGYTPDKIPVVMGLLNNSYFSTHNIHFEYTGYADINESAYSSDFTVLDDNNPANLRKFNALINTGSRTNAINIYLLGDNTSFNGGRAAAYTSTAFVVGGIDITDNVSTSRGLSPNIAHEMGHCLGLYHTFESTRFGAELVNGQNRNTTGDKVSDTAAEPAEDCEPTENCKNYRFKELANCRYPSLGYRDSSGTPYFPEINNIMSYIRPSCMTRFTPGQGARMRMQLASSPVLAGVFAVPSPLAFVTAPLPSIICTSNGSQTYAVQVTNNPGVSSYTWSISAEEYGSYLYSINNDQASIYFAPGDYTATLTVIANYPCGPSTPITQTVHVSTGPPPAPVISEGIAEECKGQVRYQILNYNPAYTYTVDVSSSPQQLIPLPVNPTSSFFKVKAGWNTTSGSFTITVSGATACGSGTNTSKTIMADFVCNQQAAIISAYPNPVSEELTLPAGIETATLRDSQGNAVQQVAGTSRLDVRKLPAGLYNLQMRRNGKLINQHIEIRH